SGSANTRRSARYGSGGRSQESGSASGGGDAPAGRRGRRKALFAIVVLGAPIVVVVFLVVFVVEPFIIIVVVELDRAFPLLGVFDDLEVHVLPGGFVDLFDLAVERADLDDAFVLVDRNDGEQLPVVFASVPFSDDGLKFFVHDCCALFRCCGGQLWPWGLG